ncbi:hypothetical protein [Nostoc flagelliforme]|uniref:hypothetical protein n=1 Tax=Nostoc flagelliforme TaxID=1306274 RepID=UPI003BB6EAD1
MSTLRQFFFTCLNTTTRTNLASLATVYFLEINTTLKTGLPKDVEEYCKLRYSDVLYAV